MLVKTSSVTVLHRGPYTTNPDDPRPLIWGERHGDMAGSFIEKLMVLDPATNTVLDNITIDSGFHGPTTVGDCVAMTCEVTRELKARPSRTGRDWVDTKDKWRVFSTEPAEPATVKASERAAA